MTNKELKKLTRTELLELLLAQTERADNLEKEIEELRKKLSEREIAIQNSGSIAEAALKINDIFNAAQAAADQYLENIKENADLSALCRKNNCNNESVLSDHVYKKGDTSDVTNVPDYNNAESDEHHPMKHKSGERVLVYRKPVREYADDID